MASIKSLGVGSGLDLSSLLANLKQAENARLQPFQIQQQKNQVQLSSYSGLVSTIDRLKEQAAKLSDAEVLNTLGLQYDSKHLDAALTGAAHEGSYFLNVKAVAQAHSIASQGVGSIHESLGKGGQLTLSLGGRDGTTHSKVVLDLSEGQSTLSGLRDVINRSGLGISASIMNDGSNTPYRLMLTSRETGTNHHIGIHVLDADPTHTALSEFLNFDPATQAVAAKPTFPAHSETPQSTPAPKSTPAPQSTPGTPARADDASAVPASETGSESAGAATSSETATAGTASATTASEPAPTAPKNSPSRLGKISDGVGTIGEGVGEVVGGIGDAIGGKTPTPPPTEPTAPEEPTPETPPTETPETPPPGTPEAPGVEDPESPVPFPTSGMFQTVAARDARVNINGLDIVRQNNVIENAIEGVMIKLKNVTETPQSLVIAPDSEAVKKTLDDFIETYNSYRTQSNAMTDFNGSKGGALIGDGTLRRLENHLVDALLTTGSGSLKNLSDIGVKLSSKGMLAIDSSALTEVVNTKRKDLERMMIDGGVFEQINQTLDAYSGADGLIAQMRDSVKDRISSTDTRIGAMKQAIEATMGRYQRQFETLDKTMSMISSTQNYLDQQLKAMNRKG
ncbi:flagellar filament capping protein FliD [Larsenimonas salina]|uniref:flagellar filament capping protein FliD n=1 Tax=Larsenimonas salina TaxID=1295565 RepID=UPI00207477BC|nr:flagellar filament capping protein FliD [Larsenimonas salina]MCM5704031.1 flagellar filament capping protein FliD [Larsenimonas salina]